MVNRKRLGEAPEKATERRLRRVESAAPIGYSSVTRGGLRIASAQGLTAQSVPGGAPAIDVTGRQRVSGLLDGDGTFTWTGPVNIGGSCTISGPLNVTGNVTTSGSFTNSGTFTNNGATNLNGATTVKGDLNVVSPGKIKAGNLTIDPVTGSGSVLFSNGAQLYTNGSSVQLFIGAVSVTLTATQATIGTGGKSVILSASGHTLGGLSTITTAASGLPVGAMHVSSSNVLSRVI